MVGHEPLIVPITSIPAKSRLDVIEAFFETGDEAEIAGAGTRSVEANDFDLLYVACWEGETIGAVGANLLGGRSAMLWGPKVSPGSGKQVFSELLRGIKTSLHERGVTFLQAVVQLKDDLGPSLLDHGFTETSQINYLMASKSCFPSCRPASELGFCSVGPKDRNRLTSVIQQTYVGTRDCPALDDARRTADVVDAYVNAYGDRREHWFIVEHRSLDVGCLLLADHVDDDRYELVYMGLGPPTRGRGFGKDMALYAMWLAYESGRHSILAGVDSQNWPAIKTYSSVGFVEYASRRALIANLSVV